MAKKVSLIMPCYNAEKYLQATLLSIIKQEYTNIELIVVDDASTDGTAAILERWKSEFNARGYSMITVRHPQNMGLCAAINTGLLTYSGDFLCFPDADDYLYPNYVSAFVTALNSNPQFGWAMCNAEIVYTETGRVLPFCVPRKSIYRDDFYDFLSTKTPHNAWMLMARKEYFERCVGQQIYNSRLTQEWSLLFPLSYYGNYLRVPQTLYRYIRHPHSMATWIDEEQDKVAAHYLELKALGLVVLSQLPLNKEEKKTSQTVLDLVYLFRIHEAGIRRGCAMADIKAKLLTLTESIIDPSSDTLPLDWRFNFLLDILLKAEIPPLRAVFNRLYSLLSHGYIIYGAGRVCRYMAKGLISAFGTPRAIWDQKVKGAVGEVLVTVPDYSFERLPVILAIASDNTADEVRDMLKKQGFMSIIRADEVIRSLRGYYAIKSEKG